MHYRLVRLNGNPHYQFTIDWSELKTMFVSMTDGGYLKNHLSRKDNLSRMAYMIQGWEKGSHFEGGFKLSDTLKWIREGYEFVGSEIDDASIVPLRKKRVFINSDFEGDYYHERFISGEDFYYSDMTKRDKVPAVTVEMQIQFASTVSNKTIEAYSKWMLQHLVELEYSGVGCGINIASKNTGMCVGDRRDTHYDFFINVKEPNEASDYRQWSVLLSPTGYRQIMFLLFIKGADLIGKDVTSCLGYPTRPNWDCFFDPDEGRLISTCTTDAAFPQNKMTEKFFSAIEYAKTGVPPEDA